MSQPNRLILPVIMCGGSGTRLWPASRESMPKQFIPLLHAYSSFQSTAQRVTHDLFQKPMILASSDVRFLAAEQLQEAGVEAEMVLEPMRRDSAAAVAVAACLASRKAPDTIVLILAADHLIADKDAFVEACRAAAEVAREGYIMTLGVEPTTPATGYGYIQGGERLGDSAAMRVQHFIEKPDAAKAQAYIDQGFLWNSGNFLFRADVMIEELKRFAPEVLAAAQAAVDRSVRDLDFTRVGPAR